MGFSTLSVIIPFYNEERTLAEILARVVKAEVPLPKEILCVDDGSTDGSGEIAGGFAKSHPEVRCFRKENGGKGSAIRFGLKYATGDIIIVQDADLEYDPEDYAALIAPIIEGRAKVVYGSRNLEGRNRRHSSIFFYVGGLFLTALVNLLYPCASLTDESTCYKVFRADVLKGIRLECDGFDFCPEVTSKVLNSGQRIVEVPISYHPRSFSQGKKVRVWDGFTAVWRILKFRFFG